MNNESLRFISKKNNLSLENDSSYDLCYKDSRQLPISCSTPAFTKINKRRKLTCKTCHLPLGYANLKATILPGTVRNCDDKRDNTQNSKEISGQSKIDTKNTRQTNIYLPDAMNISVAPSSFSEVKGPNCLDYTFMFEYEKSKLNIFSNSATLASPRLYSAREVYCEGCGACLGIRYEPQKDKVFPPKEITLGEANTLSNIVPTASTYSSQLEAKKSVSAKSKHHTVKEELDKAFQAEMDGWLSLSLDKVDLEPLLGLIGGNDMQFSSYYYGGESYSPEFEAIEDNEIYSQCSNTWLSVEKRSKSIMEKRSGRNRYWSLDFLEINAAPGIPQDMCAYGEPLEQIYKNLYLIYEQPK